MKKLLLAVVAVALIGGIAYMSGGCDGAAARVGVAKDKVIKQIDKVLGELNVKRKEVQIAYDRIQDAYVKLREKRIEAKILNNRFTKDVEALESQQAAHRANLEKLKPLLEEAQSSGTVTKNGKEVTIGELKGLAEKTVKDMKRNKELMAHKKRMATVAANNLKALEVNEKTSKKQLADLKTDLEEIDQKKEMLDSMKTDASLFTGEGTSINDEFEKLSKDVQGLMDKVDTQIEIEDLKLQDRIEDLNQAPESVEDFFKDDTDVTGVLGDIDNLLNEDK